MSSTTGPEKTGEDSWQPRRQTGAARVREPAGESVLQARAALSRLVEPGDALAGVLVDRLGAEAALDLIRSGVSPGPELMTQVSELGEQAGLGGRQRDLALGLERWRTRCSQADGARDLATIRRLGGGLLVPEDPHWPEELDDLGAAAPLALWHRGAGEAPEAWARLPHPARRVAVVGSREVTDYGRRVTAELVEDLVGHGICVISGGAYGVDAAAHRAALRRAGAAAVEIPAAGTVAVLAGGLDRFYPAGNEQLLRGVGEHGLLLSEMAPGGSPTRHRFLQRNRLIAALSGVIVVVEARWRSGAQNTAHHAFTLGRPVGAVPGSVHSASSAGCHRLLRETPAMLVTDAADVVELITGGPVARRTGAAGGGATQPALPVPSPLSEDVSEGVRARAAWDALNGADRLVFEALPLRRGSSPSSISAVAGLPMPQVLGGLTRLQRQGLARETGGRWSRAGRLPS